MRPYFLHFFIQSVQQWCIIFSGYCFTSFKVGNHYYITLRIPKYGCQNFSRWWLRFWPRTRSTWWNPFFWLFLIQVYAMVMYRRINSFGLCLNMSKQRWELHTRFPFWQIANERGTHLAVSFLMCNSSCETETTEPIDMSVALAISRSFTFGSSNTISWILLMISSVITSFGRPHLNSVNHLWVIPWDDAESG